MPTTTRIPPARVTRADHAIAKLTKHLGTRGVSIEVKDPKSDVTFDYGATRGMLSGSIAKLYILEVLLLQHHAKPLDPDERTLAVRMIERSDNDAANDLYVDIGEGSALRAAAATLHVKHTVPGPGIYWGFDRTSARDNVALLHNLTRRDSPLPFKARSFALRLMAHVESDQRWGVSAAADKHTVVRLKNGWLPASPDNGRWLVNSVGIITAHRRRLLVAVLTQHGSDFESGVALVRRLAKISVRALTG